VLIVVERFPWMQKVYVKMLTVETTAEIINQPSALTSLIQADSAFVKLIEYWDEVSETKRNHPVREFHYL